MIRKTRNLIASVCIIDVYNYSLRNVKHAGAID